MHASRYYPTIDALEQGVTCRTCNNSKRFEHRSAGHTRDHRYLIHRETLLLVFVVAAHVPFIAPVTCPPMYSSCCPQQMSVSHNVCGRIIALFCRRIVADTVVRVSNDLSVCVFVHLNGTM